MLGALPRDDFVPPLVATIGPLAGSGMDEDFASLFEASQTRDAGARKIAAGDLIKCRVIALRLGKLLRQYAGQTGESGDAAQLQTNQNVLADLALESEAAFEPPFCWA